MSLSQLPLTEILRAFQSSEPAPGGGSASALAGAVGASLLAMVAALPKPRVQGDDQAQRLTAAGGEASRLSARLAALMDRDTDAYNFVVAAFRLPKGTEAETRARTIRVQEALRAATEAPLDVMRACGEAMHLATDVAAFGNRNASSEVQVAVELLRAGLRGAKLNVDVNLASITDDAFTRTARIDAEQLRADGERHADSARARLGASG